MKLVSGPNMLRFERYRNIREISKYPYKPVQQHRRPMFLVPGSMIPDMLYVEPQEDRVDTRKITATRESAS